MEAAGVTFKEWIEGSSGTGGVVGALNTYVMPTIVTLVLAIFLWRAAQYLIIQGSDQTAREKGRQTILWGIIAMVSLAALWGIVNLLLFTLGIKP